MLDHAITRRWPALHPDRLQLYSLPTPNGVKVAIALEELGLPYEAHRVNFGTNDQFTPEFLALNPNNKIPAIIDPGGPGSAQVELFESGAILLYLAEKSGRLLGNGPLERLQVIQWLMREQPASASVLAPATSKCPWSIWQTGGDVAHLVPSSLFVLSWKSKALFSTLILSTQKPQNKLVCVLGNETVPAEVWSCSSYDAVVL